MLVAKLFRPVLGEEIPVYSNQTWESLLLLASQLTRYKPKIIYVNDKIGTYGSSAGSVAILVNRNSWLSVILPNICYVNGQLNGQTITNIIQDDVSVNIPSFYKDYDNLTGLTEAVRGIEFVGAINSLDDADNIKQTSIAYVWSNNYGVQPVITIKVSDSSVVQIHIHSKQHIQFRYSWNNAFVAWVTLV